VKSPAALTVPQLPACDQTTAVLPAPVTVAVNCWLAPEIRFADLGDTETEICADELTVSVAALLAATPPEFETTT
jgi:hypothetical protein